jgi:hypothetical protein
VIVMIHIGTTASTSSNTITTTACK